MGGWGLQACARIGCVLAKFAVFHSRRADYAEQKIWWRGLCRGWVRGNWHDARQKKHDDSICICAALDEL